MYRYETHLHTNPVSRCAHVSVRKQLELYKSLGYDGVFITNHFLDGNVNIDYNVSYDEKMRFYLSDYREGVRIGKELGIKVFFGVELTNKGSDFLVYGLDGEWYLNHPEIMNMKKSDEFEYLKAAGGFIVHAHPFREAGYIDHIRLYPRGVNAVEVINAARPDEDNELADYYATHYKLLKTAGTDNHHGAEVRRFAGIETETPMNSETDYIEHIKNGTLRIFCEPNPLKGE